MSKHIELRSEKAHNLIGKVPPVLLRYGITIISLVTVIFIIALYFIPYKESISFNVQLSDSYLVQKYYSPISGNIFFCNRGKVLENSIVGYVGGSKDSIIEIKSEISGNLILNCKNNSTIEKGELLFIITSKIENLPVFIGYIPSDKINAVTINQKVEIEFINPEKTVYLNGFVSKKYSISEKNKYKIEMLIKDYDCKYDSILYSSEIKAKIVTNNKSVFKYFFNIN